MEGLSTPLLMAVFGAGGLAVWIAGLYLTKTTDALDERLGLGEAMGGMILLAVTGSLPEVAITVSAAVNHNMPLAAGNLIGGIAIQTLVLALCDIAITGKKPLSFLVGSLNPVLEAMLVVLCTTIAIMGALLPPSVAIGPVSPASLGIVVVWVAGIAIINRARQSPQWQTHAPGSQAGRPHRRQPHPTAPRPYATASTAHIIGIFAVGSIITLGGGVILGSAGGILADRFNMTGLVFGATVLALISALPEVSSGLAAVKLGDHQLIMGDMFGGNAFQLCIFLLADILAGAPVLPASGAQNEWLAIGGILLTGVYASAVIVRPGRRWLRMGADSVLAIAIYALIVVGLLLIK